MLLIIYTPWYTLFFLSLPNQFLPQTFIEHLICRRLCIVWRDCKEEEENLKKEEQMKKGDEKRKEKKWCHENLTSQSIRTHFIVIIKQILLLALLKTAMEDALRCWCLKQVSKDEWNEHRKIQAKWIEWTVSKARHIFKCREIYMIRNRWNVNIQVVYGVSWGWNTEHKQDYGKCLMSQK